MPEPTGPATRPRAAETLSELVEQFIAARSYRPASAKQRRVFLRQFIAAVGDTEPQALEPALVLEWWSSTERLKPASRRAAHSVVSNFLRWCDGMGHPTPNVLDHVRRPRTPYRPPTVLTDDQLLDLRLSVVGHPTDELIIALMADAGLRRAEVSRLRGQDVDHARGRIVVDGKGGVVDVVPLPRSVARLVPEGTTGRLVPITADAIARRVHRALDRAGVKGHTSHSLRRTYATNLMRDGRSAVDVMRLLRHASLNSTTRYVRSTLDDLPGLSDEVDR